MLGDTVDLNVGDKVVGDGVRFHVGDNVLCDAVGVEVGASVVFGSTYSTTFSDLTVTATLGTPSEFMANRK